MYSDKVLNIFKNPKNAGRITKADGIADSYNADETAHVEFSIRVQSGIILECRFRAQAYPYIVAVCDSIADMVAGKMVSMLTLEESDVKKELADNSDEDIKFCVDCLKLAVADHLEKQEKKNKKGE